MDEFEVPHVVEEAGLPARLVTALAQLAETRNELEKERKAHESTRGSNSYLSQERDRLSRQLTEAHRLMDAIDCPIPQQNDNYADHSLVIRIAAWLHAQRQTV